MDMIEDLSLEHRPLTDLFPQPRDQDEWSQYRLTDDQIEFFQHNGYLAGVRLLNDNQVEILRDELKYLIDPSNPGRQLFYEYNSNESSDPSKVLFHALGAWRVSKGFH